MDTPGQGPMDVRLADTGADVAVAPKLDNQTLTYPAATDTETVSFDNSQNTMAVNSGADINSSGSLDQDMASQSAGKQISTNTMNAVSPNVNSQNITQPSAQYNTNGSVQANEGVGENIPTQAVENIPPTIVSSNEANIAENGMTSGWDSLLGNKKISAEVAPEQKNEQAPLAEISLGTISGKTAGEKIANKPEVVPEIVSGSNIEVARSLGKTSPELPVNEAKASVEEIKTAKNPNPLGDLYRHLEEMAENSQLMAQQEAEAERRHQSLEEMQDEVVGWRMMAKITSMLMVFSWGLSICSLFFPYIFKNIEPKTGLSADFILFIVTIMVLLTCTILSFWINTNKVFKVITWLIFCFFVVIFVMVAMKSAGLVGGDLPVLGSFLTRFNM